jgi:hypothetical protein
MPIRARSRLLAGSRTALPLAALLPALALTAACGGGDGAAAAAKEPQGVVASGAVSTPKLTGALLTAGDVPDVQVLPAGSKTQLLGGAQRADRPQCQPIVDQWSSQPKHPRQVYTGAMITDTAAKDKKAKTISLTVIASYKPGDAKAVLDELTAAVRVCRDYRVTRNGATSTFSVRPATASATGAGAYGDQQVAYTIAGTARGAAGVVLVTVVRTGETTAGYETVRADHQLAALRPAIPLKQSAKLRAAATGN